MNPIRAFFHLVADVLARRGVIDDNRGDRIAALAWPRFLTMFARRSNRVADISMVGLSVGATGIAGLAFAGVYWTLANGLTLALASGTINQVSQRFGARQFDRLDLAVKQSVWISLAIALPFAIVYWAAADSLIAVFTDNPETQFHGSTYLSITAIAVVFMAVNLVSSRTLAGADDTWIAMAIRASGAVANIVFNAIFIFGFGMGAAGAALGTVVAEGLIMAAFVGGFVFGSLPIIGAFPVRISVGPPYIDVKLSHQLLIITQPVIIQRLGRSLVQFPLFGLLAAFGPIVVAAFESARRVRELLNAFGSGFSISASSLVGQALGRGDEPGAKQYSRDVIWFSGVVYVSSAAIVFLLAPDIARLFGEDPAILAETSPFIRIAAISFVGYGLNRTFQGILEGAGDNRWSMYGRLFGQYLMLLPLVYLGSVTPLGLYAVYLALITEMWSAMLITGYRFWSGAWIEVSRSFRPQAAVD